MENNTGANNSNLARLEAELRKAIGDNTWDAMIDNEKRLRDLISEGLSQKRANEIVYGRDLSGNRNWPDLYNAKDLISRRQCNLAEASK